MSQAFSSRLIDFTVSSLLSHQRQSFGGLVQVKRIAPQLRTTNLAESIRFYTATLGCTLEFQYEDFYAGIRAGEQIFHLKLIDETDPSIAFVHEGEHFHLYFDVVDAAAAAEELKRNGVTLARDVEATTWGTREFVILDDQGHTLYFGDGGRDAEGSATSL